MKIRNQTLHMSEPVRRIDEDRRLRPPGREFVRLALQHPRRSGSDSHDAAAIVLHHHEWFDGRGYPHGLAGAEIPIGSRIVAIADAYEAMISDRPYKRTLSHDEALSELRRGSGTQFDPELVDIFVALFANPASASLGALPIPVRARKASALSG